MAAADDPVVTKDAKATFKRTFPWDIDKSVECAGGSPYGTYSEELVQKVSGTVKCDYTIDVTKGEGDRQRLEGRSARSPSSTRTTTGL